MPAPQTSQQWPVPGVSYVAGYPTADQRDFYVFVYLDSKVPGFTLPTYGDAHPDGDRYPDHKVTLVQPDKEQGRGWWIVVYFKDLEPQDDDNFDVTYPYGPTRFPRITRTYIIPRADWLEDGPLALGTDDPGMLPDEVTQQFPGATLVESDTLVEQTGDALIDSLYVKVTRVFEHIPNLADGTDAAAAAGFGYKIEYPYSDTGYSRVTWTVPATAETVAAYGSACPISGHTDNVLIEQQYVKEKGVIVGVSRVYEKLPSPWTTTTKTDEDGVVLTSKHRLQVGASISSAEAVAGGTWTRTTKDEVNAYYGREVAVTRALPGTAIVSTKTDEDGQVITETRTLKEASTITAVESVGSGTWTRTVRKEVTALVAWQITETRPLPGTAIISTKPDEDGQTVTTTRTLKEAGTITASEAVATGVWTRTSRKDVTALVAWEVKEARPVPGTAIIERRPDDDGIVLTETRTLKEHSAITPAESVGGGTWTRTIEKPVTATVSWESVVTRALPGNAITSERTDEDGVVVTVTKTLKEASTITASEAVATGVWTRKRKDPVTALVAYEVIESRAIPGTAVIERRTDEDGIVLTETRTMKEHTAITPVESVGSGVWTRVVEKPITATVSWESVITRALPGNAVVSQKTDDDGIVITLTKTLKEGGTITTEETLATGTWTRKRKEAVTALVAHEVIEARAIPGNAVTQKRIDEDGMQVTVARTLKEASTITASEALAGGTWTKIYSQPVTDLVAAEIVETRAIPGNSLTYSVYDALTDTIVTETRQLIDGTTAAYTPTSYLSDYRDVPQGSVVKLRVIRDYPAGITAKTIIEYAKERFMYPALLYDFGSGGSLGSIVRKDGSAEFFVNPVIEGERPRTVQAKLTTTFITALAGLPTPLNIQTQRLSRRGPLFGLSTGPVLCNSQTITATTPSGDPNWDAGVIDSFTITASSPTKDTWTTARTNGDYFVLDYECKKIASGLWMLTKVEIPYL